MSRKRDALAALFAAVLGFGALAVGSGIVPLAAEVCVTSYEDSGGNGDTFSRCDTPAGDVKIPNLAAYTTGLHNGCNRGVNQSSSWTDCISSARVGNLPGSTKVVWYQNTGYVNAVACWDANGSSGVINFTTSATNDLISSFRILGGNC